MRVAFSAIAGGPKTGEDTRWQWGMADIRASISPGKKERETLRQRNGGPERDKTYCVPATLGYIW